MCRNILLAMSLACSAPVLGAPANGGFELGLSGWTTVGDASVQTAELGSVPTGGVAQALLTNASSVFDDDAPAAAGACNFGGVEPESIGSAGGMEERLGLAVGDLDGIFAQRPTEGSGLLQRFTAAPGTRVALDWNLLTSEPSTTGTADFAFVSVDGVVTLLADSSSASLTASATAFERETGYSTWLSDAFTSGGAHTLVLGVVDLNDFSVSSALLVDEVRLVPLPAARWLLGSGLLGYLGLGMSRCMPQRIARPHCQG